MAIYNLEERTLDYAIRVRTFIGKLPATLIINEDAKQLVRSSGSVGANYIEANEAISKKDFKYRMRIARKEVKESRFWLKLIDVESDSILESEKTQLIDESTQLLKILSSILLKSQ
ncbi:MAG: four helix bundle protein [Balneolaceae bacterium]|nr:four helix bundle protein [Balneolaceae bacterium]